MCSSNARQAGDDEGNDIFSRLTLLRPLASTGSHRATEDRAKKRCAARRTDLCASNTRVKFETTGRVGSSGEGGGGGGRMGGSSGAEGVGRRKSKGQQQVMNASGESQFILSPTATAAAAASPATSSSSASSGASTPRLSPSSDHHVRSEQVVQAATQQPALYHQQHQHQHWLAQQAASPAQQHHSHLLDGRLPGSQLAPPFHRATAGGQLIVQRTQNAEGLTAAAASGAPLRDFTSSPFPPSPFTTQQQALFAIRTGSGQNLYPAQQSHLAPTAAAPAATSYPGVAIPDNPTRLYHTSGLSAPTLTNANAAAGQTVQHTFGQPPLPSSLSAAQQAVLMSQDEPPHTLQRGASAGSSTGYTCPNCSKAFARDDLLRRHLAREARAAAQPSLDRQKSCFECARSKARCDLEVPMCGRCRARGKSCVYGARSGNPNVRKTMRDSQEMNITPAQWTAQMGEGSQWPSAGMTVPSNAPPGAHMYVFPKNEGSLSEDYESDESHNWSDSYQQFRGDRTLSNSSSNTTGSFDYQDALQPQDQQTGQAQQEGQDHAYPIGYNQTAFAIGAQAHDSMAPPLAGRTTTNIDTSIAPTRADDDEATPISRAVNAVMGPPQVTPTRARDASAVGLGSAQWPGTLPPQSSVRPQVPRLLTGARMPRPPEAGQSSARPLFSAQLDLSGWLEEPVIPSPLYRMGPSLSALGASGSQSFVLPTPTIAAQASSQLMSSLLPGSNEHANSDTVMGAGEGDTASKHAQVAARNWWAAGPQERTSIDSQEVAQACAGHFTLYPALMVLPDATSPVPPLFHRPWLAHTRLDTPASFAQVRVALAAYHVRLPASEAMVWDMIKTQAKLIVASYDTLAQASDMDVFSSTSALWFLIILLLMSSDPSTGQSVDEGLTDSCLVGLSHLSRLLLQRVQAMERKQSDDRQAQGASSPSFIEWGFLETMRRTLFACYALFVLQRFRATSPELQSRLAGAELVLDIKLPATASEFEAGNELEWRAAQHVKITDSQGSALANALTMRELLQARTAAHEQQKQSDAAVQGSVATPGQESKPSIGSTPFSEERKKQMLTYFDRHDDFTNVCLTVMFALDARI